MNGRQKFHSEWRLESFDQLCDVLKVGSCLRFRFENLFGFFDCSIDERQGLVGVLATICETKGEVPLVAFKTCRNLVA